VRRDEERMRDILEAIQRIERYANVDRSKFDKDDLIQTWMLYHIQIIGEAAAKVSPETQSANPEIPWKRIVAMRNVLVHDYFGIDLDEVWNTIQKDIPSLKSQIEKLLD
jgi:uncharacterized protein with HEPN domain